MVINASERPRSVWVTSQARKKKKEKNLNERREGELICQPKKNPIKRPPRNQQPLQDQKRDRGRSGSGVHSNLGPSVAQKNDAKKVTIGNVYDTILSTRKIFADQKKKRRNLSPWHRCFARR
jgi:hypothetical protein